MRTDFIDPKYTRQIAAIDAMSDILEDGEWHGREELVDAAIATSPDEPLTRAKILNLLNGAARHGDLDRWPKNAKRAKYGARKFRERV